VPRRALWSVLAGLLALSAVLAWMLRDDRRFVPTLPYHDRFAQQRADEWEPLDGTWLIQGSKMIEWTDARGAKLLMGSPEWRDYEIAADVQLRAHDGDVGLMGRVLDAEFGTDAYHGYYVGLRSDGQVMVLGRANHSWLETKPERVVGGVEDGVWFHLRLLLVGCTIAAEATNLTTGQKTFAAMRDEPRHCIRNGQAGLRSLDTSGAWRNVTVRAAGAKDMQALLASGVEVRAPRYPLYEAAYSEMRMRYFADTHPFREMSHAELPSVAAKRIALANGASVPVSSVRQLRAQTENDAPVRMSGVVTFVTPLYVQDETGGMQVEWARSGQLSVGDTVDVRGHVEVNGRERLLQADTIKLLEDRSLRSPVSITPVEAASGRYEGSLVELTGRLLESTTQADGSLRLRMQGVGGSQTFDALVKSTIFESTRYPWSNDSTLRVRGICRLDPQNDTTTGMTLLVSDSTAVTELAGPSWTRGWRLAMLLVLGVLAVLLGVYVFFRVQRAKHQAILGERERISHDMHDTLAQGFAGVGYHLQGVRKSVREGDVEQQELLEELDTACRMVTETHREASATIAALHPAVRREGDLLKLLESSTLSMLDKGDLQVSMERSGEPWALPIPVEEVLFRVGLEALANVLRHAQATEIVMSLRYTPWNVTLGVRDNGVGMSEAERDGGFGLATMRRRCEAVHAELVLVSGKGEGCEVRVTAKRPGGAWWRFRDGG